MNITINGRNIGPDHAPYIIAEACDNHLGVFDMAIALVDMAKSCGADAVKFQHHLPDEEMLPTTPMSDNMKEPLYDWLKKHSLTLDEHKKLAKYCKDIGDIDYLCTPFSWKAAQEINDLVPAFKIGSGEAQDFPFIKRVMGFGKPMIVSTGMSTWDEVKDLKRIFTAANIPYCLMHCVSEYPPIYKDLNIKVVTLIKDLCGIVGYSDHTSDIFTSIAAIALGASIVEKHITLSNRIPGPDDSVSISPEALNNLCVSAYYLNVALDSEKCIHPSEKPIREWAYRSIVYLRDMKAGEIITEDDIWSKRPGNGVLSKRMPEFIGRKLAVDVAYNTQLKETDVCA